MEVKLAHVHRQLDVLVVVRLDGDRAVAPSDDDALCALREAKRIGARLQAYQNLVVGLMRREPNLLAHVIHKLIMAPVDLTNIATEINDRGKNKKTKKAAEPTRSAARCHQLLCTPSTTF